jgi:hypothetical protein
LEIFYEWWGHLSHESLGIYQCKDCGQIWKIRRQWDDGTGSDNIWLRPGESKRGYEFTIDEYKKYTKRAGRRARSVK